MFQPRVSRAPLPDDLIAFIETIGTWPSDELLMVTTRRITRENGDTIELPTWLSEHWLNKGDWKQCSFAQVYTADLLVELQELETAQCLP